MSPITWPGRPRRAGSEDQLVAAAVLETGDITLDHLWGYGRARRDLVGIGSEPGVVRLDARGSVFLCVRPEREVSQRKFARLARPAGLLPDLVDRAAQLGEHLRRAATHDPAVDEAGHAAEAGRAEGADDQLRPALTHRRRPDRAGQATFFAAPDPLQLLDLLREPPAPAC